jgi:hypothetical protein
MSSGTHNHIRLLSYYRLYLPNINIVKNAEIGGLNSGLLHASRNGCAIAIQARGLGVLILLILDASKTLDTTLCLADTAIFLYARHRVFLNILSSV